MFWNNSYEFPGNIYNKEELYLGPSIYNSSDSCIYFYCQFGIFKGNIKKDLRKLENWDHVLETKFMWYYGMPSVTE
jgi:hypothetical protein